MYNNALLTLGLLQEAPRLAVRSAWNYEPSYPCTADLLCERTGTRHKADCPSTARYSCQCYKCSPEAL